MTRSPATLLATALACVSLMTFVAAANSPPYVMFAHASNSLEAVRWAMGQGANGVEMDIRFGQAQDKLQLAAPGAVGPNDVLEFRNSPYSSNEPFTPGLPCDCVAGNTCADRNADVCNHMVGVGTECSSLAAKDGSNPCSPCIMRTPAKAMMELLASYKHKLAVVYLDSKVDAVDAPPNLAQAGTNIVAYVEKHLFGSGYRGQVIVSCPSTDQMAYLQAAVAAAKSSPNSGSYYFTIDGQSATQKCLWTNVLGALGNPKPEEQVSCDDAVAGVPL
jgi:hypothetical protein